MTQWEVTLAELLSSQGYTTGHFGKWHLGSENGRLPNDQGFDEWYGIPRTMDEAFWPSQPGYKESVIPPEHIMEGRKGETVKWHNWKLVFYGEEHDWRTPPAKLGTPKLFNLITDPTRNTLSRRLKTHGSQPRR